MPNTLVDPREPDYPLEVYAVKAKLRPPPPVRAYRLGDRIAFLGYGLSTGRGGRGQHCTSPPTGRPLSRWTTNIKSSFTWWTARAIQPPSSDHYPFHVARRTWLPMSVERNSRNRRAPPTTRNRHDSAWPAARRTLAETVALPLPDSASAPTRWLWPLRREQHGTPDRRAGRPVQSDHPRPRSGYRRLTYGDG